MAFPVAPGHPQYAGTLIPEVWSPLLDEKFYEFSVLEHIANTNWEGEIKGYGSKVNIRTRADINVLPYSKGMDLAVQTPESPNKELVIDRGFYWNFLIEDVDRVQADIQYLEEWTEDAAEKQNENTNEVVLGEVFADVDADNQGDEAGRRMGYYNLGKPTAPLALTAANVVPTLGMCASVLTEAKVPRSKRWMSVPPWITQLIYESPYNKALVQGNDQDLLRKGHIGTLSGFDLFETNQLAVAEDGSDLVTNVIFGHISAITFASQFVNSEVIPSERKFGRFARGINVFGFNVIKPDAIGLLYCKRGTE